MDFVHEMPTLKMLMLGCRWSNANSAYLRFGLHSGYMKGRAEAESKKQKAQFENWAKCLNSLGWLMGLEPTTTGITILDSTN
jgi:hypothetical protein